MMCYLKITNDLFNGYLQVNKHFNLKLNETGSVKGALAVAAPSVLAAQK